MLITWVLPAEQSFVSKPFDLLTPSIFPTPITRFPRWTRRSRKSSSPRWPAKTLKGVHCLCHKAYMIGVGLWECSLQGCLTLSKMGGPKQFTYWRPVLGMADGPGGWPLHRWWARIPARHLPASAMSLKQERKNDPGASKWTAQPLNPGFQTQDDCFLLSKAVLPTHLQPKLFQCWFLTILILRY